MWLKAFSPGRGEPVSRLGGQKHTFGAHSLLPSSITTSCGSARLRAGALHQPPTHKKDTGQLCHWATEGNFTLGCFVQVRKVLPQKWVPRSSKSWYTVIRSLHTTSCCSIHTVASAWTTSTIPGTVLGRQLGEGVAQLLLRFPLLLLAHLVPSVFLPNKSQQSSPEVLLQDTQQGTAITDFSPGF